VKDGKMNDLRKQRLEHSIVRNKMLSQTAAAKKAEEIAYV